MLVTVDKQEGIHVSCDASADYVPGASGKTVTKLILSGGLKVAKKKAGKKATKKKTAKKKSKKAKKKK